MWLLLFQPFPWTTDVSAQRVSLPLSCDVSLHEMGRWDHPNTLCHPFPLRIKRSQWLQFSRGGIPSRALLGRVCRRKIQRTFSARYSHPRFWEKSTIPPHSSSFIRPLLHRAVRCSVSILALFSLVFWLPFPMTLAPLSLLLNCCTDSLAPLTLCPGRWEGHPRGSAVAGCRAPPCLFSGQM